MIHSKLKLLRNDARANVGLIFSLIMLPIALAVSVTVDPPRQASSVSDVKGAADIAALAGARAMQNALATEVTIEATAVSAFFENIGPDPDDLFCSPPAVESDLHDGHVIVDVECTLVTAVVAGFSRRKVLNVSVSSEARANFTELEMVLMLDISKSMSGQALSDLKTAAAGVAQSLLGPNTRKRVSIGLAPFASGVNAGQFGNKATGRDVDEDPERDGGDRVCLTERTGIHALTDTLPHSTETHIGPVQMPYRGASGHYCPSSRLLPLTTDYALLDAHINSMSLDFGLKTSGRPSGHMGIAWSWYLISPEWADVWSDPFFGGSPAFAPKPYDAPNLEKAVILISDGAFDTEYSPDLATADLPAISETLCENMRAEGIQIYAIALDAGDDMEAVMRNCAGPAKQFYAPAVGDDLSAIYGEIASNFMDVALIE